MTPQNKTRNWLRDFLLSVAVFMVFWGAAAAVVMHHLNNTNP